MLMMLVHVSWEHILLDSVPHCICVKQGDMHQMTWSDVCMCCAVWLGLVCLSFGVAFKDDVMPLFIGSNVHCMPCDDHDDDNDDNDNNDDNEDSGGGGNAKTDTRKHTDYDSDNESAGSVGDECPYTRVLLKKYE